MRYRDTLFCGALLGSAFALAALTPAAGANLSHDAWKRVMAIGGEHAAHRPPASSASRFRAAQVPAHYADLHDFAGGTGDGSIPSAEVTLDASGNIYGTTDSGGANSYYGTLFKLAPDGTETLLHSFGGTGDGSDPDGAVTVLSSGDMYGTTGSGGASGSGTIWELAADGTYTVLHSFADAEASSIRGRMVRDKNGNFYGTGLFGGANEDGSVFEYGADGTLTVLHSFAGSDGEFPEHGVVRDKAGNLYGATAFGGASDEGVVYKIAADGTFSTLYSFADGADGGFLYGGLAIDKDGNLYGSTADGGAGNNGTVFKLAPDGTLTTLYAFSGGSDGGTPEGNMLRVGKNLYSTTYYGGDPTCQCGVVYKIDAKGAEKVVHAFLGSDGENYSAGLTARKNFLYGTTEYGGASGNGVVFSLKTKRKR